MVAPALPQIAEEFHITSIVESQIVLSIFVLAFAVGPLILGPLSEVYGRVTVLQASNVFYLVFNTAAGFSQSKVQMMVFRCLSGLGGSAPLAIGGGVLGDLFKPEERGKAMALYGLGPLLGPSIGPIAGGWIAMKTTWRWMFWAVSIADLIIFVFGIFNLKESYAPQILYLKAKRLRRETGNADLRTEFETPERASWKFIPLSILRSFRLLFTQPIVQVLAVYMAYSYGLMYLVLATFPPLFQQTYHESLGIAGLNYISLGLGFFFGAPLCGKTNDVIYQKVGQLFSSSTPPIPFHFILPPPLTLLLHSPSPMPPFLLPDPLTNTPPAQSPPCPPPRPARIPHASHDPLLATRPLRPLPLRLVRTLRPTLDPAQPRCLLLRRRHHRRLPVRADLPRRRLHPLRR